MTKAGHGKSLTTRAKMLLGAVLVKKGAVLVKKGAVLVKKAVGRIVHRDRRSRGEKLRKRAVRALSLTAAVAAAETVRRKAVSKNSAVRSRTKTLSKAAAGAAAAEADHAMAVTVNCPPERLEPLPEPLAALGHQAEVTLTEAPGGRGTEIHVRPVEPPPTGIAGVLARVRGDDPRQDVRLALRQTKSLIETGEVLSPDTPPTTHSTLAGKPLELAIRRSHGEGRL